MRKVENPLITAFEGYPNETKARTCADNGQILYS